MASDHEIESDVRPFLLTYKSGRVERLMRTEVLPASLDRATGVVSKDVVIDPATGVSVRLYLPNLTDSPSVKLPILVYFHGGGFVIESAASPTYHNYLNRLAAKAAALIVSVDYRLAPEHPFPAAYDDSVVGLNWVVSQSTGGGQEPWLADHGDFGQLFLAGDSAGANIAHYVAMRADAVVNIEGVALVHPYFCGIEPVSTEIADPEGREFLEKLWRMFCPETEGMDDPPVNPLAKGAPSLEGLRCKRVVVFVAENDILRERGRMYYEALVGSGWGGVAELVEDEAVGHVFHFFDLEGEKALGKMKKMVGFLRGECSTGTLLGGSDGQQQIEAFASRLCGSPSSGNID